MLEGIDVSTYQGAIDWGAVAGSDVAFAWIKATEGVGWLDPHFRSNWRAAADHGLVRGAYHFARPDQTPARLEAAWFWAAINMNGGLKPGDLLALDLETGSGDLSKWATTFLQALQMASGLKAALYTSRGCIDAHGLATAQLAAFPLWLADWGH